MVSVWLDTFFFYKMTHQCQECPEQEIEHDELP